MIRRVSVRTSNSDAQQRADELNAALDLDVGADLDKEMLLVDDGDAGNEPVTPASPGEENERMVAKPDSQVKEKTPTPSSSSAVAENNAAKERSQGDNGQMRKSTVEPPTLFGPKGPDNQTLLRLLEAGEELQSMFRCARIQGLESSEGLLLFGKEHYYVVDGYTLLKTREIRDLDYLPEE